MKKIISLFLVCILLGLNSIVFAAAQNANNANEIEYSETPHDDAPVWAEYVAPKYREPRSDFSKGASIAELTTGIILTELLITAPIGLPMLIHGTTRVKMVSYNNRKNIFDEEIEKARYIDDDAQRQKEYQRIIKKCHLKESTRRHYLKKEAKRAKKAKV